MLPSTNNTVGQNVQEVAEVAAAAHYLDLKSQGRTMGPGLCSSVPQDDPAYITGNAGAMVILHFLIPLIGLFVIAPALIVGALPIIPIIIVANIFGQTVAAIVGVIAVLAYIKYIAWRLVCCKLIPAIFKGLVA